MQRNRKTLKKAFSISGYGLFSGQFSALRFKPQLESTGIRFISISDGQNRVIPAHVDYVISTQRNTTLGNSDRIVMTVEHVMSALSGMGIDDVDIEIEGSEIPILDGSARCFVEKFKETGTKEKDQKIDFYIPKFPLKVSHEDAYIIIFPDSELSVHYTLSYPQEEFLKGFYYKYKHSSKMYEDDICAARTFSPLSDLEKMKAMKIVRPEALKSSLIIDGSNVIAYEGLRFQDEPVRHKILDLLGDLHLSGIRFLGAVYASKSGHALDFEMAKLLLKDYLGEKHE